MIDVILALRSSHVALLVAILSSRSCLGTYSKEISTGFTSSSSQQRSGKARAAIEVFKVWTNGGLAISTANF